MSTPLKRDVEAGTGRPWIFHRPVIATFVCYLPSSKWQYSLVHKERGTTPSRRSRETATNTLRPRRPTVATTAMVQVQSSVQAIWNLLSNLDFISSERSSFSSFHLYATPICHHTLGLRQAGPAAAESQIPSLCPVTWPHSRLWILTFTDAHVDKETNRHDDACSFD